MTAPEIAQKRGTKLYRGIRYEDNISKAPNMRKNKSHFECHVCKLIVEGGVFGDKKAQKTRAKPRQANQANQASQGASSGCWPVHRRIPVYPGFTGQFFQDPFPELKPPTRRPYLTFSKKAHCQPLPESSHQAQLTPHARPSISSESQEQLHSVLYSLISKQTKWLPRSTLRHRSSAASSCTPDSPSPAPSAALSPTVA